MRDTVKMLIKEDPSEGSSVAKKGGKLLKKETVFTKFRAKVENLVTNEQVLELCLREIGEREAKESDWSEYVFFLKMVRDLLREFNFGKEGRHTFADELLLLYAYNDCYF